MTAFAVKIAYDDASAKFYVRESEIVGLNAEEETLDQLAETLRELAPILVRANQQDMGNKPIKLLIEAEIDAEPLAV